MERMTPPTPPHTPATSPTNDLATLTITGPTARLELNRPEQRNALSLELLQALHARVDELAAAGGVTVCVITGAGRSFCAGMDLKQIVIASDGHEGSAPGAPLALLTSLAELTLRLRALPCVTLARVNGAAIGGGCGLTCVCDIAVTHAEAKLGYPEVDLGLCPAVVAPWLVKKIGAGPARAMLLRGGIMSGADAHARGLVEVCAQSAESLDNAVDEIVSRLAAGGPTALAVTKRLLNEIDGSSDRDQVLRGAELSASVVVSPAAQAVLRSRLESTGR
ncbi:MAG: enoyl-CoA hydratase/carnithine racemase [Phycisphaerales bacterium]|jgi:enoyl-CoA hydratase/carnithine racemase